MTFIEIVNAIADQFGDASAAMIIRIKRYVNWSQQDVCSRLLGTDILFGTTTIATIASTGIYTLDATADKLIDLYIDSNVIHHMTREELDSLDPSRESAGIPSYWTEAGRDAATGAMKIELYPIPSSVLTVTYNYRKAPTDMVADNSISIIPAKYHKVMYLGGVAQCYDYDQDPSSLTYWTQYDNMIDTMKTDLLSGSEDTKNGFRPYGARRSSQFAKLPPDHFSN